MPQNTMIPLEQFHESEFVNASSNRSSSKDKLRLFILNLFHGKQKSMSRPEILAAVRGAGLLASTIAADHRLARKLEELVIRGDLSQTPGKKFFVPKFT